MSSVSTAKAKDAVRNSARPSLHRDVAAINFGRRNWTGVSAEGNVPVPTISKRPALQVGPDKCAFEHDANA